MDRITRFTLERYLAGELPAAEVARVDAEVAKDEALRAQLDALKRDHEAFLAEVPYASFRIEHEKRVAGRAKKALSLRLWLPSLAVFGAAAALFFSVGPEPQTDETRIKGSGVALTASVALPGGPAHAAVVGENVTAGTRVQLAYEAGDNTHLAIFGIDAQHVVTQYFPEPGHELLVRRPAGAQGPLPFSLTLDATPGKEQFVAVFAREPLPIAPILAALRERTPLPAGVSEATFWLQKKD